MRDQGVPKNAMDSGKCQNTVEITYLIPFPDKQDPKDLIGRLSGLPTLPSLLLTPSASSTRTKEVAPEQPRINTGLKGSALDTVNKTWF